MWDADVTLTITAIGLGIGLSLVGLLLTYARGVASAPECHDSGGKVKCEHCPLDCERKRWREG